MNKICSVENCSSVVRAKGKCASHRMADYRREKGLVTRTNVRNDGTCVQADCDAPMRSKGLCGAHYAQHIRVGKPKRVRAYVPKPKPDALRQSSIPCRDCGAPSWADGMCQLHYNAFKLSPEYAEGLWQFVKKELNLA